MISATGDRGFTLLELLVVLAIMVLLAGAWSFAAPHLFPAQQLRNESQRLASALRAVRMSARITGIPQEIDILPSGIGYHVATESRDLPTGLTLHLHAIGDSSPVRRLTFFPDGSSTGGRFELALAEHRVTIGVGAMTGRAEILE